MLKSVAHAIQSAVHSQRPTATFLLLPNWANRSINAYMKTVQDSPESCVLLGMIPQSRLTYDQPQAWHGFQTDLPEPNWSMNIIVAWNAAGRQHLQTKSPSWLQELQKAIPEAIWRDVHSTKQCQASPLPCPNVFAAKKEDTDCWTHSDHDFASGLPPFEPSCLELKCPNWQSWAFTDGSCIKQEIDRKEVQFIGAGVYTPETGAMYSLVGWE